MTTREWYKTHEGWLGALALCVGAFAFGMLTATLLENRSCTIQINALTNGFTTTIAQKDAVIGKLSTSTASASNSAVQASESAFKAADTAVQAVKDSKNVRGH